MDGKILVAYASTHGAMKEVAEVVADTLRHNREEVDLKPAREVRDLAGYRAVVLGAPLYMFHWHKDALRFLNVHHQALASLPVAVFAGGPFGEATEQQWQEVRKNFDGELAKFPWLTPVRIEIVGGRFDPAHLRFPYNLIPAMKKMPPSDLRDWNAIRAWAEALPDCFA